MKRKLYPNRPDRSSPRVYYEFIGERQRQCPHCRRWMIVSNQAITARKRNLTVVREMETKCPYCRKDFIKIETE